MYSNPLHYTVRKGFIPGVFIFFPKDPNFMSKMWSDPEHEKHNVNQWWYQCNIIIFRGREGGRLHSKTPHVVTVLWLDSDDVVTILSPTSGTSGWLQNHVSVPPLTLHSDCV